MRSDTFFREIVGIGVMQHTHRVGKNKCYYYNFYLRDSFSPLTPDVCKEYSAHLLTVMNTTSMNLTSFSHLADMQREKEEKSKLYLLENARQFWVILQVHYSPEVQDFFLQKEKHMRKAEEEGRLVDFQVQFKFLDLCLPFAWNSSI